MNFLLFPLRHLHRQHASHLGIWAIASGCHRPQMGHICLVAGSEITYQHMGTGLKSTSTLESASFTDFRREAPPHQVQASLRVRVGGCLNPAPAVSTFVVSPQDIPLHATAPSAPSSTEFMCPVPPGRSVSNCDPHEVADTQVTQPCTSPHVF